MDDLDYVKDIAMDNLDDEWFLELMDMAEQAGGTIGITAEGRLVICGARVDAIARWGEMAHVEILGPHVLGFKF
jgi:hypothetical protein